MQLYDRQSLYRVRYCMPTILIFYTHIPYYTGITLVYIHELAVKPKQLTGIAGPQVRLRPEAPIMGNFPQPLLV